MKKFLFNNTAQQPIIPKTISYILIQNQRHSFISIFFSFVCIGSFYLKTNHVNLLCCTQLDLYEESLTERIVLSF